MKDIVAKVLVLYYSSYGHIEAMAKAAAEGARSVPGTEVVIKRVPELVPADVAKQANMNVDQEAPIAATAELADYDAIRPDGLTDGQFLGRDRWPVGAGQAHRKVGSVFTSTATQHGGQEATILSTVPMLLHHGMVVVGLPYSFGNQMGIEAVKGGTPYGASTIATGDGSRQPSAPELAGARFQGAHVAKIAAKLA